MSDTEEARRQARQSYVVDPMTSMANEQAIRDAELRNAHNAEIDRQRRADDDRKRQQQG